MDSKNELRKEIVEGILQKHGGVWQVETGNPLAVGDKVYQFPSVGMVGGQVNSKKIDHFDNSGNPALKHNNTEPYIVEERKDGIYIDLNGNPFKVLKADIDEVVLDMLTIVKSNISF